MKTIELANSELISIFQLFFDELPYQYEIINTSRGNDFYGEEDLNGVSRQRNRFVVRT